MNFILYPIAKNLVFVLLKTIWRMKVIGTENIPRTGGVIIAANHRSLADPPIVGSALKRQAHFMAKEELFEFGPFGWLISNLNAHPLRRSGDVKAFRMALKLLRTGCAVILFPEGRRAKTDELAKAKPGIGLLSIATGCPIVPAYLHNSGHLSRLKKVTVQFGSPVYPEAYESHQALADEVLARIQSMKDRL